MIDFSDYAEVWKEHELDLPQIKAICEYIQTGRKVSAAKAAGVSTRTIYNWLDEDGFSTACSTVLNDVINSFKSIEPMLFERAVMYLDGLKDGIGLEEIEDPVKRIEIRKDAANKVASLTKGTLKRAQVKQSIHEDESET